MLVSALVPFLLTTGCYLTPPATDVHRPGDSGPVDSGVDATAPTVSWISPANNATISGAAPVSVTAEDDVGVDSVSFAVDDAVAKTVRAPGSDGTWAATVDTTGVDNGVHTLTATAADAAGNTVAASISVTVLNPLDADGDGYPSIATGGTDCDDTNPAVHPNAQETCATLYDDDCNGSTNDEGANACFTYYADKDGDGYGDPGDSGCYCETTGVYDQTAAKDCDDTDSSVHPGAAEVCRDGIDQNCDGSDSAECSLSGSIEYEGQGSDEAGTSVAGVRDVNGDGYDDVLVGAMTSATTGTKAGAAYLVLGSASPASGRLRDGEAEYSGELAGDEAGAAVSGGGDVNGDGFADMVVGAVGNTDGGRAAGAAYLLLGGTSLGDANLDAADATWTGAAAGALAGCALDGKGDVNGDGYADVLIGASGSSGPGAVFLVLGSPSPASSGLALADAAWTGESTGDAAGFAVSEGGDVDGDGLDDVLIGAYTRASAGADAGAAYLVLGSSSPRSASLSTADAEYDGVAASDFAGAGVAIPGDVNGDGYADVLVGAYGSDDWSAGAGAAYLMLGGPAPVSASLSSANAEYLGEGAYDSLGSAIGGAGDVNADGYADLLFGAADNSTTATYEGAAYLVLGSATPAGIHLTDADAKYSGEAVLDAAGYSLAGAGDFNGDGLDDLVVGAENNTDGGTGAGAAYVALQ